MSEALAFAATTVQSSSTTIRLIPQATSAFPVAERTAPTLPPATEMNLAFREGKCGFLQMSDIIEQTMNKTDFILEPIYEDYVQTDKEARKIALEILKH